jgi:hypothetical protein
MDPAEFLAGHDVFWEGLTKAFNDFVKMQQERVERFEQMYQELDKLDFKEILKTVDSFDDRDRLVFYLTETFQPFIRLWKPDEDADWVAHPKYKRDLFDRVVRWKTNGFECFETCERTKQVVRIYVESC